MWSLRASAQSAALALLFGSQCLALELRALPEFFRPDPFGGIVESDREGAAWLDSVKITAARGGYASFQVSVTTAGDSECQVSIEFPLTTEIYREWFHFNTPDKKYYPDALIPVHSPYRFQIPDSDNHVPGQTAQGFWIDLWIPRTTEPKIYRGEVRLASGSQQKTVPIELTVLPAVVPEDDAVTLDNNSYGTSWLFDQYPRTLGQEAKNSDDELFRLIHAYHRIFYEHRGTFHQLGYGHAGKVGPEFAPVLSGVGRHKHIVNWDQFDRHYGPLFDGSAFRGSRRGARPIPYVYLPINPEWPASFVNWGEPGYEAEFVNVVSEMEHHFRIKNWTSTRFEVFFNQKKRYKGFPWDGDEVRFERDNRYFIEYHRMLEKAVPENTPVHFVMRADTSWTMAKQFDELKGIVTFWVAGEGELSWYPAAAKQLKQRGDTVWTYGGTPPVQRVTTAMTLNPLRSWIDGVDGFVRWLTVSPGPDPWFKFGGGAETLVYPGERFGVAGPLASIRLKIQRDCLQDLALLERAARLGSRERIKQEVVGQFNGTKLSDWQNTHAVLPTKPVLDWNNADFEDALKPFEARFSHLQPAAWLRVREIALQESRRPQ
ncbi:MAG TPA: hypothetical protein VKV15_17400 [Bryobacteraceae bacterium]|nr:hypothetical protein [Bryobacteraceae bacterium]